MFDAQRFAARLAARQDRWPLLEGWADAWCHSFQKQDGYSEAELDRSEKRLSLMLPAALRELYQFAGRSLSKYNDPLLAPEDLDTAQGLFFFWAENQYVVTWGVKVEDLASEDPPVYVDLSGCDSALLSFVTPNKPVLQNETFSEFVFQMIVWDYMMWERRYLKIQGEQEVARLLQTSQPLGFPERTREEFARGQGFVNATTKFYGNETSLVLVLSDKYACCVPRNKDRFLRHCTKGR